MGALEIPSKREEETINADTLHPLSPSVHPPRRSNSYTFHANLPSSSSLPVNTGYFDLHPSRESATAASRRLDHHAKNPHVQGHTGSGRRHHAASISTLPRQTVKGRVTQADLLGVGGGIGGGVGLGVRRPASLYDVVAPEHPERPGMPRSQGGSSDTSPMHEEGSTLLFTTNEQKRKGRLSVGSGKIPAYMDSVSKEDAAVLEMRFEVMSDEELGIYLSTLFPLPGVGSTFISASASASGPRSRSTSADNSSRSSSPGLGDYVGHKGGSLGGQNSSAPPRTPRTPEGEGVDAGAEEDTTATTPRAMETRLRTLSKPTRRVDPGSDQDVSDDDDGDKTPLFPPSPPVRPSGAGGYPDHPLRVLSRAVREMKERLELLEEENEQLRMEVSLGRARKSHDKSADQASIHDGLTEALSTSLTSPASMPQAPSLYTTRTRDSEQIYPSNASVKSIPRPRSPASSISVPFPPSPILPASSTEPPVEVNASPAAAKRTNANRASWTSGLWVWNKKQPKRKGSSGSLASFVSTQAGAQSGVARIVREEEEDVDAEWRKGDGGSSPAFKAIFLATRIITPDPSSILTLSSTPANSLVAYLAHTLVSNARDEGIHIIETRRNSRSRAASVASADNPLMRTGSRDTSQKDGKGYTYGYGETAVAMGKSLLSSVSGATLRSSKSQEEHPRPSLLSRVSSSRPFPTTAVSPPMAEHHTHSSLTSPTEEAPPPSVELASIVPDETRPPTVLLSRRNLGNFFLSNKVDGTKLSTASRFKSDEPPLTDRYGFIYDIQHASMLKDASVAGAPAPASLTGNIPTLIERHSHEDPSQGWIEQRQRRRSHDTPKRSATPNGEPTPRASFDSGTSSLHGSHDNLTLGIKSHTPESITPPSSRPASMVNGAPPSSGVTNRGSESSRSAALSRHRSPSNIQRLNPSPARPVTGKDHLTVSARGASSLVSGVTTSPSSPLSASLAQVPTAPDVPLTTGTDSKASRATVSSLLDQLTDIHDKQQEERKTQWDAFLRKRQKAISSESKKIAGTTGAGVGAGVEERGRMNGVGMIGVAQMGRSAKGEEWKVFGRLVRGGIPLSYRGDIWAECSGAKDLFIPGEYAEILARHSTEDSTVLSEIEKDVSRTFPGNVFFGGDGPGVAKLRRVLVAYSWHNPSLGYCQGMNMLAATLLLTYTEEERAYWTLLAIIERLLPPTFFSPTLLASRACLMVLEDLVRVIIPKVSDKLGELGVDLASITFGWFLSLFTDCLPVETLFRVWDVFFVEGRDSLFRVAIAILKSNEADILTAESVGDLFGFVGGFTSRLWAADKLISLQHHYRTIIKHSDVEKRFQKHLAELSEVQAE